MLTDRFAKIQLFPVSAVSTAVVPQGSVASATVSFPKRNVLLLKVWRGVIGAVLLPADIKGTAHHLIRAAPPKGAGGRNHCRQCLQSLIISRPASSQGIATEGRSSSISSPGRTPNENLGVRSQNFTSSHTIQCGFSIRRLVRERVIQKQWKGKKTKLK